MKRPLKMMIALILAAGLLMACDDDGNGTGEDDTSAVADTAADDTTTPQDTSTTTAADTADEDTALDVVDADTAVPDVEPDADVTTDTADLADTSDALDSEDVDADVGPLPADTYCESTAAMFCDFYLRCGRMAVADEAECLAVFAESCNAKYEPLYAELAGAGRIELSAAGIATCADHLATVACEDQIFDLDGPCAGVWVGQEPVGGNCGPSVDYYTCAPGTACVLDLSFCGTCKQAAALGDACGGETTCAREARCLDGICVARRTAGESCDDTTAPCVIGATCSGGVCVPLNYVAVGESCDQTQRCPYKAACVGGTCVEQSLLGELCGSGGCATGTCDDTDRCVALGEEGDACASGGQCVSQVCDEVSSTCRPIADGFCGP